MCLHSRLTVVLTRPVYLHIRHYAHTEYVVVGVVTQHTTRVGARAPISVLGMLATPFFASEHDWKLKDVRLLSCLTKVKNIHISTFTHAVVCVYSMFLCLCTPWLSLVVSCCLWLSLSVSVKSCKGILLCPQVGKIQHWSWICNTYTRWMPPKTFRSLGHFPSRFSNLFPNMMEKWNFILE